ncbi:MAG: glycosyltransferase family 2 protein [Caldilineales bacterium]|nr:glycosyltransferase family 2 protein [Caldilineales bacterium]
MTDGPLACTCIIPCYNERARIAPVLAEVLRVANLAEVIVVDDGSTDGTADLVAQRFPGVTLLRLLRNQGKAAAVQAGVDRVATSHALLLDADLRGLRAAEIEAAVALALARPDVDMVILRRVKAGVHARLCRGDVLFSGERIVKTNDLRAALATSPDGYQIEIALNRYMALHGKRVVWVPSSARNTLKMQKHGPVRGLTGDIKMVKHMIDYAGLGAFVEQFLFFARDRAALPTGEKVGAPSRVANLVGWRKL